MTIDQAVEILWQSVQHGVYYPEALKGQLTLSQAYRVQLGVLARAVQAGQRQAGWKIGLRVYPESEFTCNILSAKEMSPQY